MFAELLGKAPGYCRGKGGSMHIADPEVGNLGANAIVGGSTGIAAGAALSAKMRGTDQVAVCFFGEGALGQGVLYEAMNIASLWRLPVVYVCENNLYNEYTAVTETTAGSMTARPAAFGIPCAEVDGQDLMAVLRATRTAVVRARGGDGPSFLLCHTYRYRGHHVGDINRSYRSRDEEERWMKERDPIALLARWMTAQGIAEAAWLAQMEAEVRDEIARGLTFALEAPYPDPSEVDTHVYV
jgi:pyruvate dehydrogenase E1 component alpha subunit